MRHGNQGVERTSPSVIVIGSGFGGLCVSVALKRAGIESFVILEKGGDVGGSWRYNTYPGAGSDVPSHLYSFSFDRYSSSTTRYSSQRDILDYLVDVSERFGLREHLRTGMDVVSARYDEDTAKWTVDTRAGRTFEADVLISAVGALHRPHLPDIAGQDGFGGVAFHTACWEHDQDLAGRDVAVIGTGPSAAQLLPHVARQARHVSVYQRTPAWVLPKPHAEFGPLTRFAFRRLPALQTAYRALLYLAADLALSPIISKGWTFRPATWLARRHLRRQVHDRELREKLTPAYPIGCKRMILDRSFYSTLGRENVELVTERLTRITRDGVVTEDGTRHATDLIIFATGFRATEFLVPMEVYGRSGCSLRDRWGSGAEAYLGVAVEGFPNLFLIEGPNTIVGHGSNVFMIECQVRLIMSCLRMFPGAIEVRPEAMRRYRKWLDRALSKTTWPSGCQSWYKTASGRVTTAWPASTLRYRKLTRKAARASFAVTETVGTRVG